MEDKVEDLRLKLIEAEAALKEAEEDFDIFSKQLHRYKIAIEEQKEIIVSIKTKMGLIGGSLPS